MRDRLIEVPASHAKRVRAIFRRWSEISKKTTIENLRAQDAVPVFRPGEPHYPLRKGSFLFHGTSAARFRNLRGPAFVTPNKEQAAYFSSDVMKEHRGGKKGRELTYRLVRLPVLLNKDNERYHYPRPRRRTNFLLSRMFGSRRRLNNVELARAFCASAKRKEMRLDGWRARLPNEVVLCEPMKFLEFVRER